MIFLLTLAKTIKERGGGMFAMNQLSEIIFRDGMDLLMFTTSDTFVSSAFALLGAIYYA